MSVVLPLAHGIGAVRDLPVPLWMFYYGAGAALIVSFIALGAVIVFSTTCTVAEPPPECNR